MISEFWKRSLTILLLLPFVGIAVLYSDFLLFLLVLLSANCMAFEILQMARKRNVPVYFFVTCAACSVVVVYFYCIQMRGGMLFDLFFWGIYSLNLEYHFVACVFFLSSVLIFALKSFSADLQGSLEGIAVHVFTVGYAGVALAYLFWVREIDVYFAVYLIGVTWMTDIGAYCCGKLFGKFALNLPVSPSKTLEGLCGGVLFAVLFACALKVFLPGFGIEALQVFSWLSFLGVTFVLSVFAILGDLAESALKRSVDMKDSHFYIPGHGGMLDVMDSLVYTSPIFYFLLRFVVS